MEKLTHLNEKVFCSGNEAIFKLNDAFKAVRFIAASGQRRESEMSSKRNVFVLSTFAFFFIAESNNAQAETMSGGND